jgi:hypothetical protein
MKSIWVAAFVMSFCLPASGFGQSALLEGFPTMLSLAENVKVNPYAQVGYQWVGSNLNLPIQAEGPNQPLFIDQMDISLIDANFWSGVVGFTALPLSGNPSKNFSVPSRVSTFSGESTPGANGVEYLTF